MSWTESAEFANSAASPSEPLSVSVLLQRAKNALERALPLCWVSGEISGFKRAASGHCYFDLKDDATQIACVLYRNRASLVGFELKEGAQVELRVRPSIYEPRGSLQFTVEQARLAGVGRLYEAFLRLKAKLEAEGLFDPDLKREVPAHPQQIGLITSPKAAALADMLRVLRDRWPRARVVLYPASVQGVNAPRELLAALNAANARRECEVLIIGRGGGSIEDLWAFNDEALVRAVAASDLPIVSAVGHETDFTLCDFAADLRAPTPTAAAAIVTPERTALLQAVNQMQRRMSWLLHDRLDRFGQRIDRASDRLRGSGTVLAPWRETLLRLQSRLTRSVLGLVPARQARVQRAAQRLLLQSQRTPMAATRLAGLAQRLDSGIDGALQSRSTRLAHAAQALALLNPQQVLDRGYAVVFDASGKAVTDAAALARDAQVRVALGRGEFDASVTATRPETAQ